MWTHTRAQTPADQQPSRHTAHASCVDQALFITNIHECILVGLREPRPVPYSKHVTVIPKHHWSQQQPPLA